MTKLGKRRRSKADPKRRDEYTYSLLSRCLIGLNGRVESVEKVAGELGIGRTYAHDLMRRARERHALRTAIVLPLQPGTGLQTQVSEYLRDFGVKDVRIIVTHPDDSNLDTAAYRAQLRRNLGAAAAEFVSNEIRLTPNDHLVVGGGRTGMAFADFFTPKVRDLVMRPLSTGGRWRASSHPDASAVLQLLAHRLVFSAGEPGPERFRIVCPEVPPSIAAEVNALIRYRERGTEGMISGTPDPEVADANGRFREMLAVFGPDAPPPRVVVTSVGRRCYAPSEERPGPHEQTSSFVRLVGESRYYVERATRLTAGDQFDGIDDSYYAAANRELFERGVVGDIARQALDADGNVISGFLDHTSVYVSLKRLLDWRERTGTRCLLVAGGSRLVHAVRAAIKTRCFDCAVIDTALALQLIPPRSRPDIYSSVPVFNAPQLIEPLDPRSSYSASN